MKLLNVFLLSHIPTSNQFNMGLREAGIWLLKCLNKDVTEMDVCEKASVDVALLLC